MLIVAHNHEAFNDWLLLLCRVRPCGNSKKLDKVVVITAPMHDLDLLFEQCGDLGRRVLGIEKTLHDDETVSGRPERLLNLAVAAFGESLWIQKFVEV